MNYKIGDSVENDLTVHLDKMYEQAMTVLIQVRQLREAAKSGVRLDGWNVRNLQKDAKELHGQASGL